MLWWKWWSNILVMIKVMLIWGSPSDLIRPNNLSVETSVAHVTSVTGVFVHNHNSGKNIHCHFFFFFFLIWSLTFSLIDIIESVCLCETSTLSKVPSQYIISPLVHGSSQHSCILHALPWLSAGDLCFPFSVQKMYKLNGEVVSLSVSIHGPGPGKRCCLCN